MSYYLEQLIDRFRNFEFSRMNKITTIFFIAFSILLVSSSCGRKKAMANADEQTAEVKIPDPEVEDIIIDEGFVPPRENGRFTVEGMKMVDNLLHLKVSYSGGCEEHIFNLYTDKRYMKSYPPKLNLFLEHIDNNDKCRAMITKELVFDVTGIEYPGTNELVLRFNNTKETLQFKY